MLRRWIGRTLAFLATTATGAIAASGCESSNSMLFIQQVMQITQPACTVQAQPDGASQLTGILDVSFRGEYSGVVLVGNQLVPRGSSDLLRTETSDVTLTSAEVQVEDATGAIVSDYSVPVSGFISASQGTTPGYGLTTVTMVDSGTSSGLASSLKSNLGSVNRLVSHVRVFGTTLGGSDVQSDDFDFVIYVCYACLINFPVAEDNTASGQPQPNCNAASSTTSSTSTSSAMSPCIAGQDLPVDCSTCVGANSACTSPSM